MATSGTDFNKNIKLIAELAKINTPVIKITHQELATELGSAREVISRQLKELEQKKMIHLHRGSIEIIDCSGLRNL